MDELFSLFRGQWKDGMLPHIVFDREEEGYFPGPEFWRTDLSPAAPAVPTSGITNPPLHAWVALHIYRHLPNAEAREFLARMFPKLLALHRYLYEKRDPHREGLAFIRHPWESGTDNSPAWDEALARIEVDEAAVPLYQRRDVEFVPGNQRPTREDYDRYVFLLDLFKRTRYDEAAIAAECPFLIQDPLFNSLLSASNEALLEIGQILGQDVGEVKEWHAQTARALNDVLWNEEKRLYAHFDLVSRRSIGAATSSGFAPFFAAVPDARQVSRMLDLLDAEEYSGAAGRCFLLPSYKLGGAAFDPVKYWRGPVWVNLNWLICRGLERMGFLDRAAALFRDTLALLERYGFHEYFSPFRSETDGPTGGFGSQDFSWSAALCIDLLQQPPGGALPGDGSVSGVS